MNKCRFTNEYTLQKGMVTPYGERTRERAHRDEWRPAVCPLIGIGEAEGDEEEQAWTGRRRRYRRGRARWGVFAAGVVGGVREECMVDY